MEKELILSTIGELEEKRAAIDAAIAEKREMFMKAQGNIDYTALVNRNKEISECLEIEKNMTERIKMINEQSEINNKLKKIQSSAALIL